MSEPLVTVLMSVYDGEKYLVEAIESILNQTFKDFEFVIINDGSNDSSRDIILSYNDPRIVLVENKQNIGLTRSLNKGISLARGKYIARMDADDISLPERLEKQVAFMEENEGVAVCGSWGYLIDDSSKCIGSVRMPTLDDAIVVDMFFYNCIIHSSTIYRKNTIQEIGGYNNDFIRSQDYELWYRCIIRKIRLANYPEKLVKLRKHDSIISTLHSTEQEHYAIKVVMLLYRDLLKIKFSYNTIDAFRKKMLGFTLEIADRIRLSLFDKRIKKHDLNAYFSNKQQTEQFCKKLTEVFNKGDATSNNINTRGLGRLKQKVFKYLKQLVKKIILKIPQVKRYIEKHELEKQNLLEEKQCLLEEKKLLLNELAYNYSQGSLAIYNQNVTNDIVPELRKIVSERKQIKVKILFIAMTSSIHAARWISQISDQEDWDLHLFPSVDVGGLVHPLLKKIRVYLPQNKENISSNFIENYYAFELSKLINSIQPDIVHTLEMQHAGYMTLSAKKLAGSYFPKWIYSCWGSDLYYFQNYEYHRHRIEEVLPHCNYLFTDSKRDIEIARNLGFKGQTLGIFPGAGGIDIDSTRASVDYVKPSNRNVIVVKGYSGWVYRPQVVLRALERCQDYLSDYSIVVYLPGDKIKNDVEEIAKRSCLKFELFYYSTNHQEVMSLFARARISLASSISDGTPNSMLEAMSVGAFPIQSDTVSTREWIDNGKNGFLAEPEDAEGFASCLKKALLDDELVNVAAEYNYKLLKDNIDLQLIKTKVIDAYRKVFND